MDSNPTSGGAVLKGTLMLFLALLPLSCLITPFCLFWPSEPEEPPIARAVSPDGTVEAVVERTVNRGTSYRISLTSRDAAATMRELGNVYDRFFPPEGGVDAAAYKVDVAWSLDSRIVSLWIGGEIRGAWDVRQRGQLPLDRVAYRIAPPRGIAPLSLRKMIERDGGGHGAGFLIDAVSRQDLRTVRTLLEAGLDVNARYGEQTALHQAIWDQQVELARFLLDHGADVNATAYKWKSNCLGTACTRGNPALVRLLLQRGAKVNAAIDSGNTPLMLAAWRGPREVVEMLLAAGADRSATNNEGQTALDFATKHNNADIAALLK
jgi:hypothetical protein